jgi:hypothetical protein
MSAENLVRQLNNAQAPDGGGRVFVIDKTVPTDGDAGYSPGCLCIHTDGGDGTSLYVNEGTVSSCNFNAITVAA